MRNEFIETSNVAKLNDICNDLSDPTSLIGPSLAMVTGPAGRGKSEAAKHYATHSSAVYLPPLNTRTPVMILREIAFEISKIKPSRSETCFTIIGDEMARDRRLIIIDEADLLPMQVLEMLRNVNERFACPILLIGEEELKGRIASRRRLSSRMRQHVEFGPVTQADIVVFFKRALGLKIGSDVATVYHRYSRGDWRPILTAAIRTEKALVASGLADVTVDLAREVTK